MIGSKLLKSETSKKWIEKDVKAELERKNARILK